MAKTRNVLLAVGCGGLLLLGLCGGLVAGLSYFAVSEVEDTAFVEDTLAIVRADADVVEALGEPIEIQRFGMNLKLNSGITHSGELTIPLIGPNGSAVLDAVGTRNSSHEPWTYTMLQVQLESNDEVIQLLD